MSALLKELAQRYPVFGRLRPSTLCRRDAPITNARDTIGWWESRRIPFNLVVGSAGILSCIIVGIVGLGSEILFGSEFGFPNPPAFALIVILIYWIMANVCFTGGWIAKLVVRKIWPREADRFASTSFYLGLVFSVLLTLTPGIVIGAGGLFGLLKHAYRILHEQ